MQHLLVYDTFSLNSLRARQGRLIKKKGKRASMNYLAGLVSKILLGEPFMAEKLSHNCKVRSALARKQQIGFALAW